MMTLGRGTLLPFALLASLAACDGGDDRPDCLAGVTPPSADTLMRFTVNGEEVLFSTGDGDWWSLDTTTQVLSLTNIRNKDAHSAWAIRLSARDFAGVGAYQLGEFHGVVPAGGEVTESDAVAQYWCPSSAGGNLIRVSVGASGDSLRVTVFDPATGLIEGGFRFHATDWRGEGETQDLVEGEFRGMVTREGPPIGDAAAMTDR